MKRSILIRTITIVTLATLLFFAAGFMALYSSSLRALEKETQSHAADKLELFQTYLRSQMTSANEYAYQFMNNIGTVTGADDARDAFENCKPQNTLFTSMVLLYDGEIVAVDAPNKLWKLVTDSEFYHRLSSPGRLKITEPYYSSISSSRVIAVTSSGKVNQHEITLICEIRTSSLFSSLNNRLGANETITVLTREGNTVYFDYGTTLFTGRAAKGSMLDLDDETRDILLSLPNGTKQIAIQGHEMIAESVRFDERWDIHLLIDVNQFYTSVNQFRRNYFLFAIPAALLLIAVCIAVSASITRPVKALTKQIDAQPGDLEDMQLVCRSQDEVGRLANSFNSLLSRLRQTQKEKEEMERSRFRLEYKMLQSQIQPHFLFNTHMCIDSLLEQGEVERARKMLSSLDLLLHNSTDKVQSLIPLRDDINMLMQYVSLQKEKMGDCFDVDYGNWEDYPSVVVPKLLLQPIVENSLRHGLSGIAWRGRIDLSFETIDGQLHIFITDNGVGIPAEDLEKIENGMEFVPKQKGMVSIGLSNVRSRIKAIYGEKGNLHVSSRVNLGTTVEVVMNLRPEDSDVISDGAF